jgi:cobalt-zinc-cadmium efflux system protein
MTDGDPALASAVTPAHEAHAGRHAHRHHADCAHHAAVDAVRAGRLDVRPRLWWALALTAGYMLAEVVGGWLANSLALLADAGHTLTDAAALGLALVVASWNARRGHERDSQHRRREAWAALVNGLVLVAVCAAVGVEAVQRLQTPEPVGTGLMLGVAAGGVVVNIAAALVLRPVVRDNLNARGAYLHVLSDLLGSVGTIMAALIIRQTGWLAADPVASLLVIVLVLRAAVGLVREARHALRAAP